MPEIALGRPPDRSQNLLRELRLRITSGVLPPGAQLPTRLELGQEFGVSSETVQRALSELRVDGFITVRGRLGTFVADRPPHLTNYALVFPHRETDCGYFFNTLALEARRLAEQTGRNVQLFYGIDKYRPTPEFHQLCADVKAHRVGGILFMSSPSEVAQTPLLTEPAVPRVAIMSSDVEFHLPYLYTREDTFWNRAAHHLHRRGVERVALLVPAGVTESIGFLRDKWQDLGFEVPRKWAHQVSRLTPQATGHLMELLFERRQEMPQALVISDDNLVEAALAGIEAAGGAPAKFEILAHCNFPNTPPVSRPVTFLGYDCRQLIAACFETIEKIRAGLPVENEQCFPALFEHELETPTRGAPQLQRVQ